MVRLVAVALLLALASCNNNKPVVFATCGDNVKNGDETDVDCGGGLCTTCNSGKACRLATDCRSKICSSGICAAATCSDQLHNGSETDIDCGGPSCPPCGDNAACAGYNDCRSHVCVGSRCAPATCSDGFHNGDETGIDCGGSCPPCD